MASSLYVASVQTPCWSHCWARLKSGNAEHIAEGAIGGMGPAGPDFNLAWQNTLQKGRLESMVPSSMQIPNSHGRLACLQRLAAALCKQQQEVHVSVAQNEGVSVDSRVSVSVS
jgi:hypothetical protein